MLQSKTFTKTRREDPKDEVSTNAKLLIRAGYIYKEMAGVYTYLPLGFRVLKKIENIIREEMNAIGGQEMFLTALQDKQVWEKSGRWSDEVIDVWFKTKLANQTEVGLGVTHEEPLTKIMTEYISSYRDLPVYLYQIQNKFRNEVRAKSGIMRGREFIMKDLYSFSKNEDEHNEFYEKSKTAYKNIFNKIGIGDITYLTFASGGSFSKFSHEFQTISDSGEDVIYINEKNNIAINQEVFTDEVKKDLNLEGDFKEAKSIEVGNIFTLGTKFSDSIGLQYKTEEGDKKSVFMGSYGIGLGRLMGTVAEVLSDDKGLVWPESIAPFAVHLVSLGTGQEVKKEADNLYNELLKKNVEVLYDDRELSAGEKLADADLLGIPRRVVVSEKTIKEGKYELKDRRSGSVELVSIDKIIK